MISATTISHMQGIAEAAAGNRLQLGSTRLIATARRVAAVVEVTRNQRGLTQTTALALLKPVDTPFMDDDGKLTDAARSAFAALRRKILQTDIETWFGQDGSGHVHVGFAQMGSPGMPSTTLLSLPWDDPEELFEATAIDQ